MWCQGSGWRCFICASSRRQTPAYRRWSGSATRGKVGPSQGQRYLISEMDIAFPVQTTSLYCCEKKKKTIYVKGLKKVKIAVITVDIYYCAFELPGIDRSNGHFFCLLEFVLLNFSASFVKVIALLKILTSLGSLDTALFLFPPPSPLSPSLSLESQDGMNGLGLGSWSYSPFHSVFLQELSLIP